MAGIIRRVRWHTPNATAPTLATRRRPQSQNRIIGAPAAPPIAPTPTSAYSAGSVAADGSARDRCAHLVWPACSTRCRPSARPLARARSVARSVRRYRAWPRLAARWRASGCAKLRRGAPHPRLDTELAGPGANRRHAAPWRGPSAGMRADRTTARPGMAGMTCCTGGKGHPENGRRVPAAGQVSMDWRMRRSSWSRPPKCVPGSGFSRLCQQPRREAEPDPGWPGRR
jgi:hypothetical protein